MRLTVAIEEGADGAAPTVAIRDSGGAVLVAPRPMAAPLDDAALRARYERIVVTRDPQPDDVQRLGEALFESLLGEAAWKAIGDAVQAAAAAGAVPPVAAAAADAGAGREPIELALGCAPALLDDFGLLPWELMRHQGVYLADRPAQVSITRLIPRAAAALPPPPIRLPLRVLFVSGTPLGDPLYGPGPGYLSLLRHCKVNRIALHTRLVRDASPAAVHAAVQEMRPHVVHILGHGGVVDGSGVVEMQDDDRKKPARAYGADALLPMLRDAAGALPAAVVLTVCHSAQRAPDPEGHLQGETLPLGAGLVAGGVPIVIGMGGMVSDRGCRLFARQFYEALASGRSLPAATAAGRRAGLMQTPITASPIEWAMPVLLMGADVAPSLPVIDDPEATATEERARPFRPKSEKVFCDRLRHVDAYQELIAISRPLRPTVLLIQAGEADAIKEGARLGLTRLARELATQAVYDGFIPVLVEQAALQQLDTPIALAKVLLQLTWASLDRFGVDWAQRPQYQVLALAEALAKPALTPADLVGLHRRVRLTLLAAVPGSTGGAAGEALRQDLAALAALARRPLLLLVSCAHQLQALLDVFLAEFLTAQGLGVPEIPDSAAEPGSPARPVPVVITAWTGSQDSPANAAFRRFTRAPGDHLRTVDLSRIEIDEAESAYLHHLLHSKRLVLARPRHRDSRELLAELEECVRGVPDLLSSREATAVIRFARRTGVLIDAADDDFMKGAP